MSGWDVCEENAHTMHVIPSSDHIAHPVNADCICGPTSQPVIRDDGSCAWVNVHHSLDGREHHEPKE